MSAKCPVCKRVNLDLWEFEDGYHEYECVHCYARLGLSIVTERTYDLELLEDEPGDAPETSP